MGGRERERATSTNQMPMKLFSYNGGGPKWSDSSLVIQVRGSTELLATMTGVCALARRA